MKKILGIMYIALVTQLMAIPKDFKEKSSEGGITVYESNNKLHYVQKIDLSKGATLKNLLKETGEVEVGIGDNKGSKYWMYTQSIDNMWKSAIKEDSKIECISNGQYFALVRSGSPTTISYPLQVKDSIYDGSLSQNVSYLKEYQKILKISDANEVSMKKFKLSESKRDEVLYANLVQQVEGKYFIMGLDTSYCYGCRTPKGRTLIGITDKNTILIFTSQKATQQFAKDTLMNGFEATDVMMLDGSGSAQLKCGNKKDDTFVKGDKRYVAQFIATVKGEIKTVSYAEKVNFIFNSIEKRYASYFPKGAHTVKSTNYLYREYKVKGKKHYLLAYNKTIYYYIGGSKFKPWAKVDTLYNSLNK